MTGADRPYAFISHGSEDAEEAEQLAAYLESQGIKTFSDWPTIPQLYVKGEFLGGCDIITEMTLSGELDGVLEKNGIAYNKDAAEAIRAQSRQQA